MSGSDWAAFAKEQALRAPGVRVFGQSPNGLCVDKACPDCGRSARWTRIQVLGETPGRTDIKNGKLVPVPAQRGGEKWQCFDCGAVYTYRDVEFTPAEQAQRTAQLHEQGRIGRVSL